MSFLSIVASCSILVAADAATAPSTRPAPPTVILHLHSAPFPHASRADGFTASNRAVYPADKHYADDSVGIYVPKGYARSDGPVDFVVHFHGHKNHVTNVFAKFDLGGQMDKSGANAILVVPQGPLDVPDEGFGKMDDAGGFARMMTDVAGELKRRGVTGSDAVGRVVLSAHSGGYLAAAQVIDHGGLTDHVTDVLLFDATYGGLGWFADYAGGAKDRRLVSICTAHLADENFTLMAMLRKKGVAFDVLMNGDLADDVLRHRGPIFVHTRDLAHDEVVSKKDYFANWVRTSALGKRP